MEEAKSYKKKVYSGFAWKFGERISTQGISFIVQIILARLLLPEQYGIIALVNIFVVFADVFVVSGFCSSLIQKKNADEKDFSTLFYCSFVISILIYIAIFLSSSYIASFFNAPELKNILRVYTIAIILYSYNSIQQAYVSRHLIFKKNFFANIAGNFISGVLGITAALQGYGVWALVIQFLTNIIVNIIVLSFIIDWHPKLLFSFDRAKVLLNYGSKIFFADLLNTICQEIRQLLIGKYYAKSDLALFNRGVSFANLFSNNIERTISSVLFPTMSNFSDNPEKIKYLTRLSMRTTSYIMFFFMTMFALIAEPLIRLLLTEKWMGSVVFLRIMCVSSMLSIISNANMQAIKAIGRSDILLKLEFKKKPMLLLLILISVNINVLAIAITMPIYSLYAALVNLKPNNNLLNYSIKEQMKDLTPAALMAFSMALLCLPFTFIRMNGIVSILIIMTLCIFIYLSLSILFKVESYFFLKEQIKTFSRRNYK